LKHNPKIIVESNNLSLEKNIGYFHNEVLKNYYTKEHQLKQLDFTTDNVQSEILEILEGIDSNTFNIEKMKENANELNRLRNEIGISLSPDNQGLKNTTDNFSIIINYINISPLLSEKLTEINNAVNNQISSEEVLILVNNLKEYNWNEHDFKYVDVFTQVYNSSSEYWNNINNSKGLKRDGDGVILADAAGALYGLLCGPFAAVCSIVEGALFSIIANN